MILLLSLILDTALLMLKIIRGNTLSLSVFDHISVSVRGNGQADIQTARLDSFPVRITAALRFLAMSALINSSAYYMILGLTGSYGNHFLLTSICTITAKIFIIWTYLQYGKTECGNEPAYLLTILLSLCFHRNPISGLLCETALLLYLLYREHQGKPTAQEEAAPMHDQNSRLYLKTIEESYRKNRALMHDLKNHIIVLRSLAEQKEYDKLLAYTDSMAEKVSGNLFPVHSGNIALDALLADKYHTARQKSIFVEFLHVRCDASLDNGDLCAIIGNLFDNAITENLKTECAKDRWISISIRTTGEELLIELKNPLFHPLKIQNGLPATDKPDLEHHGIGLKNVRRVCDAYGGRLLWNDTDGVFTISAQIKLSQHG